MLTKKTALSLFVFSLTLEALTNADVPRPRGVSLLKASLYYPTNDKNWVCLDGSQTIPFVKINDDYCDCADGSDEPGTSACSLGQFHCANVGHRAQDIPSSRVNDGICDCCDGSDEYEAVMQVCPNTCRQLGLVEQELRKNEAELHKLGAAKRTEMINKGQQLRVERDIRRAELERRRNEQQILKVEKEELKKSAEAIESEALDVYREQQREVEAAAAAAEATKAGDGSQSMREEAEMSFSRYDTNKDGFVEVTELQVDMTLDRDHDGVVTVEEARFYLDERDRCDLENYITLSWPRIKTTRMLAEGLFKPPSNSDNDEAELLNEEQEQQPLVEGAETDVVSDTDTENNQGNNADFETDEEEYEDEEGDVGVGSAKPETVPQTEYDPETQRIMELANEARNAYADVERTIREIENEIKEIDDQNAKDYGANEEFTTLDGECFKFEDREYVYTLCPFDRASQKQRSGGSETTLGRWDHWVSTNNNKYAKQKYSHGASCWNGPQRSALVQIKCALEHKITSVTEPNRCEYFFEFETPAACVGAINVTEEELLHDEL